MGEDALFTCYCLPKRPAEHIEMQWYRLEASTPVMTYEDGAEMTKVQMEEERGWVELRDDGIAEERVALKIHNIQASNNWPYWCHLQEGNFGGEVSLLFKVAGVYLDKDIRFWREDIINL